MEEKEFIDLIKKKRETAMILQKDIAKMIPMNKASYCKIENGKKKLSFFTLRRLAEIWEIDLNQIKNQQKKTYVYMD